MKMCENEIFALRFGEILKNFNVKENAASFGFKLAVLFAPDIM